MQAVPCFENAYEKAYLRGINTRQMIYFCDIDLRGEEESEENLFGEAQ